MGPLLRRLGDAAWRLGAFGLLALAFAFLAGELARLAGVRDTGDGRWVGTGVALAASLAASWAMMAWAERRPFGALGFAWGPSLPREWVVGTAVGAALLGAAVVLLAATGGARWSADVGTPAGWLGFAASTLLFFALAALLEEVVFRGYPFQVLARAVGAWPAVAAFAVLFALLHAGNPNVRPLGLVNISLAGVLLAAAYLRTRSLWFATGVHLGWNWMMASLLDLPVSGMELDTPLYTGVETGPDWWTGGTFGPEAGLAATAAIVAGTAWLLRTRRLAPSPEVRALGPLLDESDIRRTEPERSL
ncbi:MAG TPA: CPBP family intramembrane glutamic endopeptidase [Longimicrobiaceae bacterium]